MNDLLGRGGPFASMVVNLRRPASLVLSRDERPAELQVNGSATSGATWPPWAACPEILVRAGSREFAGLSWCLHPNHRDTARAIASALDGLVVRYNEPCKPAWRTPYGADQEDYFEVIWAQDEPDTLDAAQLAEAGWYYSDRVPPTLFELAFWDSFHVPNSVLSTLGVFALGVNDLQFICEGWNLVLPTRFRCPVRIEHTP